jgi:hypothetical protein
VALVPFCRVYSLVNVAPPVNKLATILCISTALLFHPNANAWSGAGHQVIAAETYRQLAPALQKKVTEILKAHPDYEKWEKSFTSESANLDLPTFIFMRSSTWPDEIRRRKSPYNHPKWHYIDWERAPLLSAELRTRVSVFFRIEPHDPVKQRCMLNKVA